MIQAIIFDCFGVLYVDPSTAFFEKYVAGYEVLKPELDELTRQYDRGLIDFKTRAAQIAEMTGLDTAFVADNIYQTHERNQPLLDFSQTLRTNYKIGMLSNIGWKGMDSFFTLTERQKYFDADILSSDVGLTKPDPKIFELMADKLGVKTQSCIMIDDNPANCVGARASGMQVILHQSNQQTIDNVTRLTKGQ